ncbi:RNA-directed DNA polymerase, eukaryota, reverse transcriptase zinc-binding domain protein [Tanacetum coccineum]
MKANRIDKVCMNVFGSWLWQNNVNLCKKGCRIAVGWDSNNVNCSLLNATDQSMLYKVEVLSSQKVFYCSFIYAANRGKDRKMLWKELSLNKKLVGNSAWLIMGDLNVSLNLEDHSEGMSTYTQDMIDFQECVNEDIDIQGHDMFRMVKKLKSLKPFLNRLNWKNGNLFEKVVSLKTKLHEVQSKIEKDPTNQVLRTEGIEALKEYQEAVEDEEKLLRQKAKVSWLNEGDKNTAYFHKVLKGRQNKSRIMTVCAEDGTRYNNCEVAEQFVKHFTSFLGIAPSVSKLEDERGLFERKISQEESELMVREITNGEIKKSSL